MFSSKAEKAPTTEAVTVIIAEDTKTNRMIAERLFKRAGIPCNRIHAFENGKLASDHFTSSVNHSACHIIYMDRDMPVMNGDQAIQLIRAHEEKHGLPASFIFTCSASATHKMSGSDHQVPKVLSPKVVNEILERAQAHFQRTAGIAKRAGI